ncbi:hypothetical protein BZG36_02076 [Bifiguratus adelaidae]|uniref:J domain-containing protein n=1 Tax=Bifiguratus adelaidae TaxID=1938954 RepID=A0A261Y346_9FUNG|nr:hypothetical protein BZG36_02076 [Bifiguratus adelaidae]
MPQLGTDDKPIDTSYYELLGVQINADEKQIKKQYRVMAIKYHPDKCREPDAEEKFKEISEAYQILSDPQLRSAYNKYGKDKSLSPDADPQEFFQQMFGGDAFREIIGELSMGRDIMEMSERYEAESEENPDGKKPNSPSMRPTKEQIATKKQFQEEQVAKLSENLIHKLTLYTSLPENADKEEKAQAAAAFQEQIKVEAEKLKEESYGLELLHAIGKVYSNKAKGYLGIKGGELPKVFQSIREKRAIIKGMWSTVKSAMDVQQTAMMMEKAEQQGLDAAEQLKLEEEATNKALKVMWNMSRMEVEGTLRLVSDRVLGDKSVSSRIRYRRAEALRMVGYIYTSLRRILDDSREEDGLLQYTSVRLVGCVNAGDCSSTDYAFDPADFGTPTGIHIDIQLLKLLLPSDVADQSNNASTTLSQMQYPIHVSPADAFAGQQVDGSDFHLSAGVQHEQQAKQQYGSVNGIDQIHQSATYMQQVSSSSSSTTLSPMTSAADANHLATISGNLEDFPRAQFGMDSGLSTPAEVISPPLPAAENISPLDTPVVRGVNVADMNAHDVITQRMNGIAFVERHIGDQPMGHETGINENTSHVSSESTSDASVPKVGSSNSQNEHQSRDVLTDEHTPVVSSQMPLADHMQAENQPSQALHNAEDFSHEMNDSMSRHGHYGSFIDTPTGASTYLGVGQGSPQKMHQSQSEMRAGASMADTSTNDLLSGENPAQHASLAGDINPSVLTMQYQQPVGEGRTNNPLMATSMEVKPDNMASEEGSVYVQPNSMQLDSIRVHAATSAVTDPNILSIDGMSGAPHESIPHDALQREHMMLFQHSMNAESMHLMQQQHMVQAAQAHAQAEIQRMLQNPGLAAASSHGQHGLMPMPTSADLFMGVPHEYTPYATSAVADMRNVKQDNPQEATANAHPGAKHPQLIYPASNPFNIHANELRYMAGPEHPGIHRLNSVAVSASSGVSQHIDAISKRQTLPRRHTVSSPYASNAKAPPLDMPEMPMSAAPHVRHDLTRAGLGHDDSRTASFKKAAKRRQSLGHLNLPPPPSIAELASLVAQRSSTGSSSQAETATLSNLDQLTKQELIEKVMQYEREKQSAMTTANSDSSSKDLKLGQLSTTDGSGEDEEDAPLTPMDTNEEAKDEDRLDDGAHSPTSSTPNSPALSSKDADEREDEEDDKHVCKWKDCQQEFPALESLISHVGEVHIGSGKNAYYCQWEGCVRENKPFTKRHKMFNHLRTHTGERPFMYGKQAILPGASVALFEHYIGTTDREKLSARIIDFQQRALAVHPYACIKALRFAKLRLKSHDYYPTLLAKRKTSTTPLKLLDIGCCHFIELGYELFEDNNVRKCRFIATNILDDSILTPEPDRIVTELDTLKNTFDFITLGSVLHLFDKQRQQQMVAKASLLLKQGGVVLGRNRGAETPGFAEERPSKMRYIHSPSSLQQVFEIYGGFKGPFDARLVDQSEVAESSEFDEPNISKPFMIFSATK